MSCDAVATAAVLWLAAMAPAAGEPMKPEFTPPSGAVALEPLFADIVRRAGELKLAVDAVHGGGQALPDDFAAKIDELARLDMKGHFTLAERGTDGDLKCILRGIAEDLPLKLQAMQGASEAAARKEALEDMSYLLRDNVEVITTPPRPDSMSGT